MAVIPYGFSHLPIEHTLSLFWHGHWTHSFIVTRYGMVFTLAFRHIFSFILPIRWCPFWPYGCYSLWLLTHSLWTHSLPWRHGCYYLWFSHWLLDIYFPLFCHYGGAHSGPMDAIPYGFSHIPFGLTLYHGAMDVITHGIHIGLLDTSFFSNTEVLIVAPWMLAVMVSRTNTLTH